MTIEMVKYWLGEDYHQWIAEVLVELIISNDPNEIPNLKKEIKKSWQDHLDANYTNRSIR